MIPADPFFTLKVSQVLCVAQAIVDVSCHVSEEEILALGVIKGGYQKIDDTTLQRMLVHFSGRDLSIVPGGSTANSLDILTSTGIHGKLLTGYGKDDFGRKFIEAYERKGCALFNCSHPGIHTGTSLILVTPDGERSMSTFLGASEEFNSDALLEISIEENTLLLLEGYVLRDGFGPDTTNTIKILGKRVREKNGSLVLALPPVQVIQAVGAGIRDTAASCDLLHGNADEFLALFEVRTVEEVEAALRQCEVEAVITEGAQGARAVLLDQTLCVDALNTKIVDLTGAGDAFLAGWLSGAIQGLTVESSLKRGRTFAAKVISQAGARLSHSEIQSLLETDSSCRELQKD